LTTTGHAATDFEPVQGMQRQRQALEILQALIDTAHAGAASSGQNEAGYVTRVNQLQLLAKHHKSGQFNPGLSAVGASTLPLKRRENSSTIASNCANDGAHIASKLKTNRHENTSFAAARFAPLPQPSARATHR
jgi:hypothetical protein